MASNRYQLPLDNKEVPHNAVGVYRFLLRFPTNYELGIIGDEIDVSAARAQLFSTLSDFERVRSGPHLTGMISAENVAKHLRKQLRLIATPVSDLPRWFNQAIPEQGCSADTLRAAAEVLRQSLDASIAVYIGMTGKQSFRTRLMQHLGGHTNLLSQLQSYKLSISQIWFECIEIDSSQPDLILALEDLAQATLKPAFSKA